LEWRLGVRANIFDRIGIRPAGGRRRIESPERTLIGILVIAHDSLGDSLADAVAHVLGGRPPQFEVLSVHAADDPLQLLPGARLQVDRLDSGDGVLVLSDLYGATPCNLACKLVQPERVECVAGVSLPMLVRAVTYRGKDMETIVRKAVSGGRDGVLHIKVDPAYAATGS
jgi:PTS system ascorbate-specific IIA component